MNRLEELKQCGEAFIQNHWLDDAGRINLIKISKFTEQLTRYVLAPLVLASEGVFVGAMAREIGDFSLGSWQDFLTRKGAILIGALLGLAWAGYDHRQFRRINACPETSPNST